MKAIQIRLYLSFGLVIGFVLAWSIVLLQESNDIDVLSSNVVLGLKVMSILISILVASTHIFDLLQPKSEASINSNSSLIKPLQLGTIYFVGSLAFFLVPILIILMIFKGVDGGELRNLIYQNMDWSICLIGLVITIFSCYLSVITKGKNSF